MINRELTGNLLRLADKYPVISVTGPRQSGKTTLVGSVFPHYHYISFENPDLKNRALNDPGSFFLPENRKMILDEVQHIPQLLSYLQVITDRNKINGQFIITGSQSLLLSEKVSQSLAGRTAVLKLLPFGLQELTSMDDLKKRTFEDWIFHGFYPRMYDQQIDPIDFFAFYFETYIQRDVRQIQNVKDLSQFTNFVRLCAGRIGQLLDYSSLAKDSGVSVNTAKGWISLLEASFIIYLLHPYYHNFSKRMIKSPKLYFTDTGLASFLLNIQSSEQLQSHYLRGNLFENLVIIDMVKRSFNNAQPANLWFYRDSNKNEIDIIYEGKALTFIEIKSARTFRTEREKDIKFMDQLAKEQMSRKIVLYGGDESFKYSGLEVISWKNLNSVLNF